MPLACRLRPTRLSLADAALSALIEHTRAEFASPQSQWSTVQLAPYLTSWSVAPFRAMQCNATLAQPNASCVRIVDDGDPLSPIGSVHRRVRGQAGREQQQQPCLTPPHCHPSSSAAGTRS